MVITKVSLCRFSVTGQTKVSDVYPVPTASFENQLVWFLLPGLHLIGLMARGYTNKTFSVK